MSLNVNILTISTWQTCDAVLEILHLCFINKISGTKKTSSSFKTVLFQGLNNHEMNLIINIFECKTCQVYFAAKMWFPDTNSICGGLCEYFTKYSVSPHVVCISNKGLKCVENVTPWEAVSQLGDKLSCADKIMIFHTQNMNNVTNGQYRTEVSSSYNVILGIK